MTRAMHTPCSPLISIARRILRTDHGGYYVAPFSSATGFISCSVHLLPASGKKKPIALTKALTPCVEMPEWLRPTELQCFVPHIEFVDCIVWPYMRDYIIQHPDMQRDLHWLADSSTSVRCAWSGTPDEALCVDVGTGHKRFTEAAEVFKANTPATMTLMTDGVAASRT